MIRWLDLFPPIVPPESFTTARLRGRPPRPDDAPAVFAAYASDPEATRFLAWQPYTSVEPLADFLRQRAEGWRIRDGQYAYLVCLRDTDTPIGSVSIFVDGSKAMFGYVFGRAYWGNGYASEALSRLVDWAMTEPRLKRAWACCEAGHAASLRVMEKAGLQREALLRRWQVFPHLGPEPRDCLFYAKVK